LPLCGFPETVRSMTRLPWAVKSGGAAGEVGSWTAAQALHGNTPTPSVLLRKQRRFMSSSLLPPGTKLAEPVLRIQEPSSLVGLAREPKDFTLILLARALQVWQHTS
jgi:hypothetical protein